MFYLKWDVQVYKYIDRNFFNFYVIYGIEVFGNWSNLILGGFLFCRVSVVISVKVKWKFLKFFLVLVKRGKKN